MTRFIAFLSVLAALLCTGCRQQPKVYTFEPLTADKVVDISPPCTLHGEVDHWLLRNVTYSVDEGMDDNGRFNNAVMFGCDGPLRRMVVVDFRRTEGNLDLISSVRGILSYTRGCNTESHHGWGLDHNACQYTEVWNMQVPQTNWPIVEYQSVNNKTQFFGVGVLKQNGYTIYVRVPWGLEDREQTIKDLLIPFMKSVTVRQPHGR